MAKNVAFFVDVKRCTGCRACVNACKQENNTRPRASDTDAGGYLGEFNYRRVVQTAPNRTTATDTTNQVRRTVTTACYHCANPACARVCPGRAIFKRGSDGVVLINYTKCIGCRACQFACPYGAPAWNQIAKKMQKCTFCQHRTAAGILPACVQTCEGKALRCVAVDSGGTEIPQPNGLGLGLGGLVDDNSLDVTTAVHPEGRHGGDGFGPLKTYKRDATTYATYLGTDSSRHAQTVPQVLFTE